MRKEDSRGESKQKKKNTKKENMIIKQAYPSIVGDSKNVVRSSEVFSCVCVVTVLPCSIYFRIHPRRLPVHRFLVGKETMKSRSEPEPCHASHSPRKTVYRFLAKPFHIALPTMPAARATPETIATPRSPSLATLSSTKPLKLTACKLLGSFSSRMSLYLLASA